jgi:aspartyl-tRNA synthetase
MFEWNEDEQRLEALHHPFTAPRPQDLASGDLKGALAQAYDLVYNGVEIGGGSLRIYRCVLLEGTGQWTGGRW